MNEMYCDGSSSASNATLAPQLPELFGFASCVLAGSSVLCVRYSSFGGRKMADKDSYITRRSVLAMSWRSLLAAAVAKTSAWTAFAEPGRGGLDNATAESFEPHIGELFEFLKPAGERGVFPTVALTLKRVSHHDNIARIEARIPGTRGKRTRQSFSLLFELPAGEPLSEGLHEFARGPFKNCPILLSHVQSAKNHRPLVYEAVFG
jgi:hypothetical protein